jgi:hypothetical protein
MRPVGKKPYQDQTLTLRIPLELDDDDLYCNKMKHHLVYFCLGACNVFFASSQCLKE